MVRFVYSQSPGMGSGPTAGELNRRNGRYRAWQTRLRAPEEVDHWQDLFDSMPSDSPDRDRVEKKLLWWQSRLLRQSQLGEALQERQPWGERSRCIQCTALQEAEYLESACCGAELISALGAQHQMVATNEDRCLGELSLDDGSGPLIYRQPVE